MRHKRLKVCTILLLGLGLTGLQAQTMYVKESSGTQTAYTLISIRKITFSGGNATVQKIDNSTGVYAMSDLRYLSFEDITTGSEEQTELGNPNYSVYPNPVANVLNIDLTGVATGGTISILTLEGKLLQEQKTNGANMATLNLSYLPQGIYLCRYSNATEIKTVKIIKQ